MKKTILIALGLALASQANAGFVTGALVGATVASSGDSSAGTTGPAVRVIMSDKHNVITCCRINITSNECLGPPRKIPDPTSFSGFTFDNKLSIQQFAETSGYKTIIRVGYMVETRSCQHGWIVMEVSK